jgi:hypothetical protein
MKRLDDTDQNQEHRNPDISATIGERILMSVERNE